MKRVVAKKKKPHGAAAPMIAVDRKSEKPLHRQIYDAFRAMILERRLQAGPTDSVDASFSR